jgi:hypothetical protein
MVRYVKDGDGRPGGGNGKDWGKGAYAEPTEDGDHLQGQHGDHDRIDGKGGDDNINGFSGNDELTGGTGADDITTGQGMDVVELGIHDPTNSTTVGDGENDTVNISVDDDPHIYDGETLVDDSYDAILEFELAVEDAGTYTPKDVIALSGLDSSINHLVDGSVGALGASADGEIVDRVTAEQLEEFLWVNDLGQLMFDADGNADTDPADDDFLALLLAPDDSPADAGVTVQFSANVEVVTDIGLGTTAVQEAEYLAVWTGDDWSISIDGGDWMVV